MDESRIKANLELVRSRVEIRCLSAGMDPSRVKILGVTKFVPAEIASMGVKCGLTDLGENRVQEASMKIQNVVPRPRWHLIGHLQSNKIKMAVEIFDIIESVDSLELAESISRRALEIDKRTEILIQVNSSGEKTKHGFVPGEISGYADKINELPGTRLTGLMTMGPLTDKIEPIKRSFESTRGIFDKLAISLGSEFAILSMGMSNDYELAIDCGANEIRIGAAIFGGRPLAK